MIHVFILHAPMILTRMNDEGSVDSQSSSRDHLCLLLIHILIASFGQLQRCYSENENGKMGNGKMGMGKWGQSPLTNKQSYASLHTWPDYCEQT